MARELYSILQIASMFGVHRNTVAMWLQQGCPVDRAPDRKSGTPAGLDPAKVMRWREDQAVRAAMGDAKDQDFEAARARKTSAEATLAEIEVEKARGRLVEVETVAKVVGEQFAAVRARLVSLGTKLAPVIAPDRTNEVKGLIDQQIYEALDELAYDRIVEVGGDADPGDQVGDGGQPAPPAEAAGERVGGRPTETQPRKRGRARKVDHRSS